MNVLAIAALLAAASGLALVRSARPSARWCGWAVVLGYFVVALALPQTGLASRPPRIAAVALAGDAAGARTALLAAAAGSDPRAADLRARWQAPVVGELGDGVLGAQVALPTPLPLQPEQLQVAALGPLVRGRPAALQVQAPPLPTPCAGELIVRAGDGVVARAPFVLGTELPSPVAFVPAVAGELTLELVVDVAGHRITARGRVEVGEPPRVLVLEPSGIAEAALVAQGVAVVAAAEPPSEWRDYAAVLVGQPLSAGAQQELVAAVLDGVGAFVLAPGFGAPEQPLRAVLPVRPAPVQPEPGDGDGAGTDDAAGPPPTTAPPPDEPPPPPPPSTEPPRGDTAGATVNRDPIEVDKRSIAMVLVVDRSGSMGTVLGNGMTKMSYAKSSALRTARALGEGDQVAVVTYGNKGAGRVELPLTDATATAVVQAGIERLAHASEMTFLLGGLQVAQELLRGSNAAVKHVVVVTDGEFDIGEGVALRSVARHMGSDLRASVSVIAITDSYTDPSFHREAEQLTKAGGGQFLPTDDPTSVPTFVVAEVTRALQRVGRKPRDGDGNAAPGPASTPQPPVDRPPPPVPQPTPPTPKPPKERRRVPVRAIAASPLLLPAPRPSPQWPPLGRAVAGTAPFDAQVLLVAGDEGWPLLAFANRGLGRVGAFAADLCGPDGSEFRAEAAFAGRLAAWLQTVLPVQPTQAPLPLLHEVQVMPPAPTPHDVAVLTTLAGSAPAAQGDATPTADEPMWVRTVTPVVPSQAPWLVLALLLLASLERWTAARALRAGRADGTERTGT